MRNQRGNVRKLSGFRLEEFLARRGIEKKIAHGDRSPCRKAGFFDPKNFASGDFYHCAARLVCIARLQQKARHRGNRGQGLTAKTECMNVEEVFRVLNLRCGMPLEGQQRVIAHHAAAVVGDLDQLLAAALYLYANAGRAGVERILQQLLEH